VGVALGLVCVLAKERAETGRWSPVFLFKGRVSLVCFFEDQGGRGVATGLEKKNSRANGAL
jgi:hypothetical protein